jgi:hypothetical protein
LAANKSYVRAATASPRVLVLDDSNCSFAEMFKNPHIQRSLAPKAEDTHLVVYVSSRHFIVIIKEIF